MTPLRATGRSDIFLRCRLFLRAFVVFFWLFSFVVLLFCCFRRRNRRRLITPLLLITKLFFVCLFCGGFVLVLVDMLVCELEYVLK